MIDNLQDTLFQQNQLIGEIASLLQDYAEVQEQMIAEIVESTRLLKSVE